VLLAHLAAQVFSIERIAPLMQSARENIARAGVRNVSLLTGDGTLGWREYAPYDAILVSAGSPTIPQPLVDQLAEGGRMVGPVGDGFEQVLRRWRRHGGRLVAEDLIPVRFVPMTGESR
jgi:protein-L-isoaspartate(D-aspartate) O-methyltransferase